MVLTRVEEVQLGAKCRAISPLEIAAFKTESYAPQHKISRLKGERTRLGLGFIIWAQCGVLPVEAWIGVSLCDWA